MVFNNHFNILLFNLVVTIGNLELNLKKYDNIIAYIPALMFIIIMVASYELSNKVE